MKEIIVKEIIRRLYWTYWWWFKSIERNMHSKNTNLFQPKYQKVTILNYPQFTSRPRVFWLKVFRFKMVAVTSLYIYTLYRNKNVSRKYRSVPYRLVFKLCDPILFVKSLIWLLEFVKYHTNFRLNTKISKIE